MRFTVHSTALLDRLAAISTAIENTPLSGLFASDIGLNVKMERYYPVATAGECTPFAYDEAGTAKAFIGLLAGIATDGQDFPHQPQLGISDELKGCKALIFTRRGITPTDEAKAIVRPIPEALTFDELLFEIGTEIEATGAKIVIIDDVAGDARWCGNAILWDLNELADSTNVMLFAGFMLNHEADEVSSWIARHAHNLLQLTAGSLNMKNDDGETGREQRYFCFSYGHPTPKRIYYGIDEEGKAFIPSELWKLLRIKEIAKMYAREWINVGIFTNVAFGTLQGEFAKGSIQKAIDEATACGIIQKSGRGTKAKLILSDGKMSRSTNAGSIALTALGNPYTNPNKTKQRKPILKFGEFKLIAPENEEKANTVRTFTLNLIGAIVTGRKWLDFDIKSPYRNTLAIIITQNEQAVKWTVDKIAAFGDGAKFDAIALPPGITDEAFLTAYKQAIDSKQPDFVFILCYDRITPNLYTTAQLAKEIAIYSKRKGICTIAESEKGIDREANDFGDEYWSISPLVDDYDRGEIDEMHGIYINPISSFSGSVGTFNFLCRFIWTGNYIVEVSGKEQKQAFLIGTFYWCNDTQCCAIGHEQPGNFISTDCTGQPLTNSTIGQAHKLGLIKVHYTSEKKKLLESRITFDREAAIRLMDNL
jgi:hypothetical protein